ncbi:unnamed protein product [Anisakis simplex]|uniref:Secreted protein n=1 Tax=Anisakis simplex TaxID=6269 RepID=A0A0M3K536_ANISI|nr:unnamed protein product [Anisakis simplex]
MKSRALLNISVVLWIVMSLMIEAKRSNAEPIIGALKRLNDNALWATKLLKEFDLEQASDGVYSRLSRLCYFTPVQCLLPLAGEQKADHLLLVSPLGR